MPFKAKDAASHTKKAKTPRSPRRNDVANSMLARGADDVTAIKAANAAVAKRKKGEKK
jgi:hypothetical protein